MKNYITISQLATITDLSIHQLRYFEEKGILFPGIVAENGYRMYGTNEIYNLIHIIFLRELDISVKDIYFLREQDDRAKYVGLLEKKRTEIDDKITRLQSLQSKITEVLEINDYENTFIDDLLYEDMETQNLKVLKQFPINHLLNAKDIHELHKDFGKYDLMNMIELYDYKQYSLCVEDVESTDLELDKGRYVYQIVFVKSDEEAEVKTNEFFDLIKQRKIKVRGKLIVKNLYQYSILDSKSICIKLMLKTK